MGKKNKVVKLTDRKIRYIIRAKRRGESTNDIAAVMKVSPSTVKRVWMHWIKTKMPLSIEKFGRKIKTLDAESERLILEVNKEQNMGARRLEAIIEFQHGKHIPHNAIHRVLLNHGLAKVNRNKSKRRKPWVRYEREHSLTLVHLDWHTSKYNGKKVCAVLDDSSRRIISGGEFDAETTENSIVLVQVDKGCRCCYARSGRRICCGAGVIRGRALGERPRRSALWAMGLAAVCSRSSYGGLDSFIPP